MRQLVHVVTESGIGVYVAEADGSPISQLAQLVNPGLDVDEIVRIGLTLGDVLAPVPVAAPPPKRVKAIKAAAPKTNGHSQGLGRPRADGTPNMRWGFTQAAVYDALRARGPMGVADMVQAFGYDPSEKRAMQAMNTALAVAYKAGVVTRETLDPYSAGNPTQYARVRYSAVIVEQSSD
jgi:hypothetical protein